MFEQVEKSIARFIDLNPEELEIFKSFLTTKNVAKKEIIQRNGEDCRNIYFINKGCIRYYYLVDGKGRATDNAFIERLWRNVKYEKLYLNPPETGTDLYIQLLEYFNYYNHKRRHQSLDYNKPSDIYLNAA
jgi:CRP-like cAMP-binding protein